MSSLQGVINLPVTPRQAQADPNLKPATVVWDRRPGPVRLEERLRFT